MLVPLQLYEVLHVFSQLRKLFLAKLFDFNLNATAYHKFFEFAETICALMIAMFVILMLINE